MPETSLTRAQRLQAAVSNYLELLVASRNLDFFTSFYRYFIQLLPAAVVAPLFFAGKIEFGVVNQSQSAFGHILGDLSLVVYQFQSLAGFSAVIDRLGQFQEVMARQKGALALPEGREGGADERPQGVPGSAGLQEAASSSGQSNGSGSNSSSTIDIQFLPLGAQDKPRLATLQGLTVCTPDRACTLVKDLTLKVCPFCLCTASWCILGANREPDPTNGK